ncbi:DUF1902 domain-containing protein [Geminocystis herdmanii]|uniref:DUF1902 domain-containing protein n=1 Tax=Geminocystis herdmanii TaxID=669359 RepID=UPI00034DA88C|nr:DUF1902 domain-containing protein [Geminocystis herdmanii]
MEKYIIDAFWDYEAQVWIATSNDILGLVTEAENIDILIQKLRVIVAELLVLNHQVKNNNTQKLCKISRILFNIFIDN